MAGAWNLRGPPAQLGTRVPLDGDSVVVRVFRTQQPARIDDYSDATGLVAENVRSIGVRAAVGIPVLAGGRLWGAMAVGSSRPEPLPADTEMRIAALTELVGTAIANTAARTELEQVAAEQAALGRVATLVAEAVPPGGVFTAVRRGRRAVRGSACRAVPLRAGRRCHGDRRGGRGLVLSRPALALPAR